MIALAATQFDLDGAVVLPRAHRRSRPFERTRRVTRTATLDGAAVLTDTGFADADRTLVIVETEVTEGVFDAVATLLETYELVSVATREGVFEAALSSLSLREGELTLNALVKQKVSA